ncbi:hypothetical protein G6M14_05590 [Agrobacterium tumefaciens]|uniref:PD-(D/E)XK nuclease domain-containing protein n=1 Tax=Agrobacterium tumefaciens TaxID=358 RepID=UPI001572C356|nr:hypothetical protein [Agrobacterium tumefaciens]
MVDLGTVRQELVRALERGDAATHLKAFSSWIRDDQASLAAEISTAACGSDQNMLPEQIAALGYGRARGTLTRFQQDRLQMELVQFSGRRFFSPGRPLRVEVDGIALLGIAFAAKDMADRKWLTDLLTRSAEETEDDPWNLGLITAARHLLGAAAPPSFPEDLAFALSLQGIGDTTDRSMAGAWEVASRIPAPGLGVDHLAVRLAAFDGVVARNTHVRIASPAFEDLLLALRSVPRAMKHWPFETKPRTPRSLVAVWHIENEYHVQALLWTILAPIFPDLEDEENLPSVGHKRPRVDLAVPTLRTLIEVKFMRGGSQSDFAKVIDEVAADASLYLSAETGFDRIVAFVWDDSAHSEQHHELQSGLEKIKGIEAAVVMSRPGRMVR